MASEAKVRFGESLLLLESVIATSQHAHVHLIGAFREPPWPPRTLGRVLASSAREGPTERIDLSGLRSRQRTRTVQ